jgi:transcriptional regulator with XRE-family HTH domain
MAIPVYRLDMSAKHFRLERSADKAQPVQPGASLRNLRVRKGWTLAEVSERTGLPVSTLSKIENDKMSLSYDKLARISAGLEVDIAELFTPRATIANGGVPSGRRCVTRAGEGQAIETENYGHLYPASELLNKRFVPIVAEMRARTLGEFGELIRHEGEEYAFVLDGTVEFHSELYAPLTLHKGDSIYFDSGMGHAYLKAGPGVCRVLSICSGAESQLMAAMRGTPRDEKDTPSHSKESRAAGKRGKHRA